MKKFTSLKALFFMAAFVLVCLAFSGTKVSAATPAENVPAAKDVKWTYDAEKDVLQINLINSATGASVAVFSMKDAEEKVAKTKASVSVVDTTGSAVTFTKVGRVNATVSIANNKAAYLFISDAAKLNTNYKVTANINILPTEVSKVTVTLNYGQANPVAGQTACGFSSAVFKLYDKDAEPVTETSFTSSTKLEWSADGSTWKSAETFTVNDLYELVTAEERSVYIYVRVKGVSGSTSGSIQRPSKMQKISIKKAAKAPGIKIDVTKNTIAIKNGYDYQVVASGNAISYLPSAWTTVLPYKKDATNTKAEVTADKFAYEKFDKNKNADSAMWTNTKVASKPLAGTSDQVYAVRKSATDKAPASAAVEITIAARQSAPDVVIVTGAALKLKLSANDRTLSKCEYIILGKDEAKTYADSTLVKWSAFTSERTAIKYNAKTCKIKDGDTTIAARDIAVGDFILVREAGVKGKKASGTQKATPDVLASQYAVLKVTAIDTENKTVTLALSSLN